MRWRVGAVLCLFAAYLGIGCREPITPNIDRNQAPETWITAAPFDTITLRDSEGHPDPIRGPEVGKIPVRFHVYWAGSDRDGAVTGFYWAVVETLPKAPEGQIFLPTLPGPKPQDYHYTTNTDSFFVFTVAEDTPDRQHAFFIYAVDNQGKPDPTPARFIFQAEDNFPPIPVFDECKCVGRTYSLVAGGGVVGRPDSVFVTDIDLRSTAPRDTCPSGSTIFFKWHGEVTVPQTQIIGYRYKLDETRFNEVGPEVTSVAYNTGIPPNDVPPSTGTKIFVLRAVDQAFGTRDSTRRFQYNFSPDSWFAGPDLNNPASRLVVKPNGERYILQQDLAGPGVVGSLLGPDSTSVLPALRPERRTFFEVWKDTVFARQEGDTVHMNSWILLHGGGFDKDSKYNVNVSSLARQLPDFPGGIVLDPGPQNGSPVAFRSQVMLSLTPTGRPSITGISNAYPLFDPNNVFNTPRIGGYHPMIQSGRAFAVMFAIDGDGSQDRRIDDPRGLVLKIESNTATPAEVLLRSKVLTFEVDHAPYLVTDSPLFRPSMATVDTFTSNLWDLRLVAADDDPFLPGTPVGRPSNTVTLRRRIAVHGQDAGGNPVDYVDATVYKNQTNINILVPVNLAPGPCTLEVELCDCDECESLAGTGRCKIFNIPVYYQPPPSPTTTSMDLIRPGSGQTPR
jgi:hypothetical protein